MNEETNKNGMENSQNAACPAKPGCRCPHHMTGPIIVIAIGVVMLLSVLGVLGSAGAGVAFSLIVIILGISMIMKRTCRCCCGKR
jgi:predicted lipid-binding transport protein (Tim44 family)